MSVEINLETHEITVVVEYGDGGKGGSTPYIGTNGNWWIDGVDTGSPSRGEPFTYEDFTPEQITLLQKPASDAAAIAAQATSNANSAAISANEATIAAQEAVQVINNSEVFLTQAAYDALPASKLTDGIKYFIEA